MCVAITQGNASCCWWRELWDMKAYQIILVFYGVTGHCSHWSVTPRELTLQYIINICCQLSSNLWWPFSRFPKQKILRKGLPFPSFRGALRLCGLPKVTQGWLFSWEHPLGNWTSNGRFWSQISNSLSAMIMLLEKKTKLWFYNRNFKNLVYIIEIKAS